MTAAQLRTRRALRGGALLAGLLGTGAALIGLVGAPASLVATLAGAGDLGADPVEVVLAALSLLAEGLTAYLLVIVALAVAAQLPGLLGQVAGAGVRMIGLPVVRRAVEAALGGVLAVGLLAGPVAVGASAQSRSTPVAGAVAAGVHSATAGATTGAAGAHLPRPAPAAGAVPPTTVPSPTATGATLATGTTVPGHGTARSAPITRAPKSGGPQQGGPPGTRPSPQGSADAPPDAADHREDRASGSGPASALDQSPAGGPVIPVPPAPDERPGRAAEGTVHLVRPGDTLWDIAAAQIPPSQRGNAATAAQWQRVYAANRATIGDNPDLILPGARLVLPPPEAQAD